MDGPGDSNADNAPRRRGTVDDDDVKVPHHTDDEETEDTTSALESLKGGAQLPVFDCPVCLQNASFPVQLPCHHIFCFLCVKGVAQRDKRCAMCRQPIPSNFFNDPKLLCYEEIKKNSETIFDEGYQWFYEGRNGWWQYDERTSFELEKRYKKGDKIFELLIAGFLYVIDLENMRQYRRNDSSRRRRVRRDLRNIPGIKGIAGLRYNEGHPLRPSGDGGEAAASSTGTTASNLAVIPPVTSGDSNTGDDSYLTPPAPNNTPQTPMTPADSQPSSLSGSQEDLNVHFQNLHLNQNTHVSMHHPALNPVRTHSPEYLQDGREHGQAASSREQMTHVHPLFFDKDDAMGENRDEEQDDDDDNEFDNSQLFNVTHNSENSDDSNSASNSTMIDGRDGFVRGEIHLPEVDNSQSQVYPEVHYEEEDNDDDDDDDSGAASNRRVFMSHTKKSNRGYETSL